MPYANNSPTYRIPYMDQGERSSGASNRRAALIIDSQLQGVARLIGSTGILQDGAYEGTFTSGASSVSLLGTAENYALEAYINGEYVAQNTTLVWSALQDNTTNYLYAQATEANLYTSQEISTLASKIAVAVWNTTGLTPPNAILLAIAVTTGGGISVSTSPSISDSSFSQRPVVQPFVAHRTANPIDHPFGSIYHDHLTTNCIRSNNLHPWDGWSSGVDAMSMLSGTGISTQHIKPQAVDSRALAASISISGLTVQGSLLTLPTCTVTLSGLSLNPGFRGVHLSEVVPLQVLQNSLSGVGSSIQSQITVLQNRIIYDSLLVGTIQINSGLSIAASAMQPASSGAQTINLPAGSVYFQSGVTNVLVNNSLVVPTSNVIPFLRTNDTTARLGAAVPSTGSFTLWMTNPPSAPTSVGFVVH